MIPRDLIGAEIELIRSLGVEFRCGVKLDRDIDFGELRRDFRAVISAGGAKRARMLQLPGAEAQGIYGGVDSLRAMSLGERLPIGRRLVVVGSGNMAFDVSRSAVRYEDDDPERMAARQAETEISRVALRQSSVREVHLA